MKNIIIKPLLCFLILGASLIIVDLIPREYIEKNVRESVQTFINEGYFPEVKFANKYLLDNFTDALMINTAYSIDPGEPIKSSILMRRNYRPNSELELDTAVEVDNPIEYLIENLNETNSIYFQYPRYWHGYMIYLRPLLVFFNYLEIRVILSTIIIALSLMLVYLVYKKINKYIAIAVLITLISSNFWVIGLSLQYSAVFIIALISSMYIVIKGKNKNIESTFFIIGMLTSFFDLLTTPIITLGIPLIFYISLHKGEGCSFKNFFKIIVLWGIGYALMWSSKWLIADIVCNSGTIQSAIQKIMVYTSSAEEVSTNIIKIISKNMYYLSEISIFTVTTLVISYICTSNKSQTIKEKSTYQYLMIAVIPFIWFAIAKRHCYIHARFTFRSLLVTIFSLSIIIMNNFKNTKKLNNNKNSINQYETRKN